MIRLFDFNFNLLSRTNKFTQKRWKLYFNGIGAFELHLPAESDMASVIYENLNPKEGKMLVIKDGGNSAIVVGYDIGDDFTVYGRTCNWLLSKKVCAAQDGGSVNCDTFVRGLIESAFDGEDAFILGDALENAPTVTVKKSDDAILSDIIIDTLKSANMGHRVDFDEKSKRWIYTNLMPYENPLVFSEAAGKVYSSTVGYDILDYADRGIYRNQNDAIRSCNLQNTSCGFTLEALLKANEPDGAASELKEKCVNDEAEFKVKGIKFKKDYNLGDILKIKIKKGSLRKTLTRTAVSAEITENAQGITEKPTFEEVENGD